eukprot:TRINITY_DN9287_c0_g1_i1.p1 TRINITY_DN9287_c0_g1~~TRINITY_DN9287_c0_g1_i1.p1  ORF type:complete len:398 (+),score=92.87 TRINITY_DN9287_c0_g1_i1:164-1357(+)
MEPLFSKYPSLWHLNPTGKADIDVAGGKIPKKMPRIHWIPPSFYLSDPFADPFEDMLQAPVVGGKKRKVMDRMKSEVVKKVRVDEDKVKLIRKPTITELFADFKNHVQNKVSEKEKQNQQMIQDQEQLQAKVVEAERALQEYRLKVEKELEAKRIHLEKVQKLQREIKELNADCTLPSEWEPQTQNCQLFKLSETSKEYSLVEGALKDTVPEAKIVRIERVQNLFLWESYCNERKRLQDKYRGLYPNDYSKLREELVFHGTGSTDPYLIYNSEEGFDMRFSGEGMWGRGIYFSMLASYSDGSYSYDTAADETDTRSHRQLFLASLIVGNAYVADDSDSSLRAPPSQNEASSLNIDKERYDSVSATTRDTPIFIVYANGRAYPSYLITYDVEEDMEED